MRRRAFITLLGGAAAAWPLAVRAQMRDRMRRVGVIMGFAEDDEVWQTYLATFRQRLQDFGWSEGHNIRFDYRFTGESAEGMHVAATEVVAMAPDVIFVTTNPIVSALMQVPRVHQPRQGQSRQDQHGIEPSQSLLWDAFRATHRRPMRSPSLASSVE